MQKKLSVFVIFAILLLLSFFFAFRATAGEKEELALRMEANGAKMELLKRDTVVQEFIKLLNEQIGIQNRLQAIEKAEKEKAKKVEEKK